MTEGYNVIAEVYDRLNAEIDYVKWADFVEEAFDKFLTKRPELVLDLACGTGIMTRELARRGRLGGNALRRRRQGIYKRRHGGRGAPADTLSASRYAFV